MKKIVWFILIILIVGFTNACTSASENESKPFVGKWDFEENDCYYELELSLYDTLPDGLYGRYTDFYEDTSMEYQIVDVLTIQKNEAEVVIDSYMGKQKASIIYDSASGNISFQVPDMKPIIFKKQDKYGYVFLSGVSKIDVLSCPISGTSLLKANRGQSFRFLDREQGWFKVELSTTNKQVGYVSPEYAFYLKNNQIPEEAFTKSYTNGLTSIMFEKKDNQIQMIKETIRPLQNGNFLPAIIESYLGHTEGNEIVFTYFHGGYVENPDSTTMSKITPYIIYYWKESEMFIMEGNNYSSH